MPAKKVAKKTKRVNIKTKPDLGLVGSDSVFLRHLRLVHHSHTSKLIHYKHTSHFSLTLILAVLGVFLYSCSDYTSAMSINGGVNIGVVVPGSAPSVGAEITSPSDGMIMTDIRSTLVIGTCPINTIVVVKNNDVLSGSTNCDEIGKFNLNVELTLGDNLLSAMVYDNLNQAGPITGPVKVIVQKIVTPGVIVPEKDPLTPTLPDNPSIIPSLPTNPSVTPVESNECNDYKVTDLPQSDTPHVSVVCIPRLFGPNINKVMGVLVWGGQAPYALSVDLGDNSDTSLRSFASSGYYRVAFKYKTAGKYSVAVKITDHKSQTASVQAAVVVNGVIPVENPIETIVDDVTKKSWFETPVPSYIMAVGVTFGFWGGDIFDRYFGSKKPQKRVKRTA